MTRPRFLTGSAALLALLFTGSLAAQESDAGETPEALKLKGRSAAPAAADIDAAVSIQSMLSRKEKSAFSEAKAATIEGWVVQVRAKRTATTTWR